MIISELYDGQGLGDQLWIYVVTRSLGANNRRPYSIFSNNRFKIKNKFELDWGQKVIFRSRKSPTKGNKVGSFNVYHGTRIINGGWHFSHWCGHNREAVSRIKNEVKNNSYHEFNTIKILSKVVERLKSKEDILVQKSRKLFRRTSPKFYVVPIDSTFPIEVQFIQKSYEHLIHDYN